MSKCPKCQTSYPIGTEFCPEDGEPLELSNEDLAVAETAYGPADVHDTTPEEEPPATVSEAGAVVQRKVDAGDALIGKTIGGVYKVLSKIGVGGMGVVYTVEHTNLKKKFALKVLGQVAQDHPDAVERFRQEAISASHIEHDNIVDIITLDQTADGHPYLVMELLKGRSLAEALRESAPLAVERALTITYQICRAVHAAHEEGIIHRDLKPENVYLIDKADTEFVKILDFGISKIHDAETEKVRITKTGHLLGTPLYMSPEQAKGESKLDRRVDVYSLGVILYEMLEGKPPFNGENYFQLIWKHSNENPPPFTTPLPEALQNAVFKALSKEPEDRFKTMLDFEEELQAAVPEVPPPAFLLDFRSTASSSARSSQKKIQNTLQGHWGISALIALVALLAVAALIAFRDDGSSDTDTRGVVLSDGSSTSTAKQLRQSARPDASTATQESDAAVSSDADGDDSSRHLHKNKSKISVIIDSQPSGALVFLDNQRLGMTPFERTQQASGQEVIIKVVKHGFQIVRHKVKLDQNVKLVIPLSRRGSPGLPGVEGKRPSSIFKKEY